MRSWMLKLFPLVGLLLATACVYRQDIPQGNFFKPEDVAKLQQGMTREQVQYVMGTPMIVDPFHPDRWDYVSMLDSQEEERDFRQRVTVFFDGNVVSRIESEGVSDERISTGDEGIRLEDDDEVFPPDATQDPMEMDEPIPEQ